MPSAMTELEAVNFMLSTIGEAPVSSLSDGNVDVVMARQQLEKVNRDVQSQGWHFNTETRYLTPAAFTGEIALPANCLQLDSIDPDQGVNVVQRGQRLYDIGEGTYSFDRKIHVEMILGLEWPELPEAARAYIAIRAARAFQKRSVGGVESFQLTAEEERDALIALKKADGRTRDVNFLTGSATVSRIAGRRGPLK